MIKTQRNKSISGFIFRVLAIGLLFISFSVQGQQFEIFGDVLSSGSALPGAQLRLVKSGGGEQTVTVGSDGKFRAKLDYGAEYTVYFSKAGYVTRHCKINTQLPAGVEKDAIAPYKFKVNMVQFVPGVTTSDSDSKAFAEFSYDPSISDFSFNKQAAKAVKEERKAQEAVVNQALKDTAMLRKMQEEAKARAEAEVRARAEAEAKARAEAEAKAKAEAEARAKAEAEAKAKAAAEAEAKRKAEEETRAKAAAEARAKAEAEAKEREKMDAEARAKAEAEAKARAEKAAADAQAKAALDEEARKKAQAEDEARRKAAADAAAQAQAKDEERRKAAAEEDVRRRAAADEAKRLADEETARKRAAMDEATRKMMEEAEAKRQADEEARRKKREQDSLAYASAADAARLKKLEEEERRRKKIEADSISMAQMAESVRLKKEEEARKKEEAQARRQAEIDRLSDELPAREDKLQDLAREIRDIRNEESGIQGEIDAGNSTIAQMGQDLFRLSDVERLQVEGEILKAQADVMGKQVALKTKQQERFEKEKEQNKIRQELAILRFRIKDPDAYADTGKIVAEYKMEEMSLTFAVEKAKGEITTLHNNIQRKNQDYEVKQKLIEQKKAEIARVEEAKRAKAEADSLARVKAEQEALAKEEAERLKREEKERLRIEEEARRKAEVERINSEMSGKKNELAQLQAQVESMKAEEKAGYDDITRRNDELNVIARQIFTLQNLEKIEKEMEMIKRQKENYHLELTIKDKEIARLEKEKEVAHAQKNIAIMEYLLRDNRVSADSQRIESSSKTLVQSIDFSIERVKQAKDDIHKSIIKKDNELKLKQAQYEAKKIEVEKAQALARQKAEEEELRRKKMEEEALAKAEAERKKREEAERKRIEEEARIKAEIERLTASMTVKQAEAEKVKTEVEVMEMSEKAEAEEIAVLDNKAAQMIREAIPLTGIEKIDKQIEIVNVELESLKKQVALKKKQEQRLKREKEYVKVIKSVSEMNKKIKDLAARITPGQTPAGLSTNEENKIEFQISRIQQEQQMIEAAIKRKENESLSKRELARMKREEKARMEAIAKARAEEIARLKREAEEKAREAAELKRKKEEEEAKAREEKEAWAKAELDVLKQDFPRKQEEVNQSLNTIFAMKKDEGAVESELNGLNSKLINMRGEAMTLFGVDKLKKLVHVAELEKDILTKQLTLKTKQGERLVKEKELNRLQQDVAVMQYRMTNIFAPVDTNKIARYLRSEATRIDIATERNKNDQDALAKAIDNKITEILSKEQQVKDKEEELARLEREAAARREAEERARQTGTAVQTSPGREAAAKSATSGISEPTYRPKDSYHTELVTENNSVSEVTTVFRNGVKTVYKMTTTNYGPVFYFRNGASVTETTYKMEVSAIKAEIDALGNK